MSKSIFIQQPRIFRKFILAGILLSGIAFNSIAQNSSPPPVTKHTDQTSFGAMTGGNISINEHLNDTLSFTDDWMKQRFVIVSFGLSLKCNGNVIRFLENKSGNTLTAEMKEAVMQLHQNCTITFEGIKSRSLEKDTKGWYPTSHSPIKLTIR